MERKDRRLELDVPGKHIGSTLARWTSHLQLILWEPWRCQVTQDPLCSSYEPPQRASAAEGARKATKVRDKGLRVNNHTLSVCDETREKVKHELELWAEKVVAVAAQTANTDQGSQGERSG